MRGWRGLCMCVYVCVFERAGVREGGRDMGTFLFFCEDGNERAWGFDENEKKKRRGGTNREKGKVGG